MLTLPEAARNEDMVNAAVDMPHITEYIHPNRSSTERFSSYRPDIDGLRAVAIVLVVAMLFPRWHPAALSELMYFLLFLDTLFQTSFGAISN